MSNLTQNTQAQKRADRGTLFAVLSAILAASVLLPLPGADGRIGHLPSVCPFYALTGLPCPGCGLTRAFVCLGHGQVLSALHWHPLAVLLYAACLLLWVRSGLGLWGVPLSPVPPRLAGRLGWSALALLLLTDAARIGWLTVHHLRF